MKASFTSFAAGVLFAIGLGVSGMTQPGKVTGFLDVLGVWDPSLLWVMAGAVAVHFVLFRMIRRRAQPLFSARFHLPTRHDIELRLVVGAAIFGVGWGLGGFCPGPGIVAAGSGESSALFFLLSMAAGMKLTQLMARRHAQRQDESAPLSRKERSEPLTG